MAEARACESCGAFYEGQRGGCGYCIACCLRWHFAELAPTELGATIHSAEGHGQAGR